MSIGGKDHQRKSKQSKRKQEAIRMNLHNMLPFPEDLHNDLQGSRRETDRFPAAVEDGNSDCAPRLKKMTQCWRSEGIQIVHTKSFVCKAVGSFFRSLLLEI